MPEVRRTSGLVCVPPRPFLGAQAGRASLQLPYKPRAASSPCARELPSTLLPTWAKEPGEALRAQPSPATRWSGRSAPEKNHAWGLPAPARRGTRGGQRRWAESRWVFCFGMQCDDSRQG